MRKGGFIRIESDRIFSAGWDLKALDAGDVQLGEWWADGNFGEGGFAGLIENWTLNKPVFVVLKRLVIGAGFELDIAGDLIIAAEHVEFTLLEMPVGRLLLPHLENPRQNILHPLTNYIESTGARVDSLTDREG